MTFECFWSKYHDRSLPRDVAEDVWNAALRTASSVCLQEKGARSTRDGKEAASACSDEIEKMCFIPD